MSSPVFLVRVMATMVVLSILLALWKTLLIRDFVIVDDTELESSLEIPL